MPTSKLFGSIAKVSCEPGYTKQGATFHLKCNTVSSTNSDIGEWTGPLCEGKQPAFHTSEEAFDAGTYSSNRKQHS